MAAVRRQEVQARLEQLEQTVEEMQKTQQGIKRKVDEVYSTTVLNVIGSAKLEELYNDEAGSWLIMKKATPQTLGEEMAQFLQLPWPIPSEDQDSFKSLDEEKKTWATSLNELVGSMEKRVITNIHIMGKKEGNDWGRVAENFKLHLRFSQRQLNVHQLVVDTLEVAMRKRSGLPYAGQPAITEPSALGGKTFLIYMQKPKHEREMVKQRKAMEEAGAQGDQAGKGGKRGQKGKGGAQSGGQGAKGKSGGKGAQNKGGGGKTRR